MKNKSDIFSVHFISWTLEISDKKLSNLGGNSLILSKFYKKIIIQFYFPPRGIASNFQERLMKRFHYDLKKQGDLRNSLVLLGVTPLLHVAH